MVNQTCSQFSLSVYFRNITFHYCAMTIYCQPQPKVKSDFSQLSTRFTAVAPKLLSKMVSKENWPGSTHRCAEPGRCSDVSHGAFQPQIAENLREADVLAGVDEGGGDLSGVVSRRGHDVSFRDVGDVVGNDYSYIIA